MKLFVLRMIGPWQLMLLFVVFGIPFLMTILILKNKRLEATEKLVWIFVAFLLPILGSLLYLFIGNRKNKK